MGSFLDGFADSFTNSYNAVTSRRSDKERTALGYETLEEERRHSLEAEDAERERIRLQEEGVKIEQGQLDINRSAEERAKEDAPSIRAGREAQTRLWAAEAVGKEYLNSEEGRAEVRRRQESDIRLQDAQTAEAQQRVKNLIQEEALAAYKNTDEYRELEADGMKALAAANRGQGAKSSAEAAQIVEGGLLGLSNTQAELQEQMDIEADAAGVPRRRVTRDDAIYAKANAGKLPWEVGEVAEGAIPEGEAAAPAEEPTAEEPEADPDLHDEPAPGEGPDEPYMGDGPLQNAPIPAPAGEPVPTGPDQSTPSTPVSSTEAPTSEVTTPDAPAGQAPLTSSTGRTLADYSAMDRQTLGSLPPSEYEEYLDLLDAAQAPVTAPAGAAIPVQAPAGQAPATAPAGGVRAGPTAGPAQRSITGARPEYTEQQAGYSTVTPGPTAGPATRPTQAPAGAATPPPVPPALAPYQDMTREELAALPPEEYQRYVEAYEDYAATLQNAARPGPTAGPALNATQAIPEAAAPGPTAGPATRPLTALPPEARQAQAPAGGVTTPPLPPRAPQPRPPARAPAHRPGTPQEPLSNTYRPEGTDVTPPGITGVSYRPGEGAGQGRVIEAQSGTRKLPLNERTRTMMEQAAAKTGVTVKVTSGAQESHGENRTGSHRHDTDVGAGDIQLIDEATGKPVSMRTAEGRAKMIEFMRAARDAGATGFGAGLDYMGENTIHVGFGNPGVWGAGGKGANAPKWLKDGMSGGAGPSSQPQGTGSRPAGVARAYQLLQQNDMPQMQAAVLAGNIQQESGGDPNAYNDKEDAMGIIQWRQDRLQKLNQFAADNGGDPSSLETQIQFLIQEGESLGSGQDQAAWTEFMSATTPEAANAALKKFIRYGDESANKRLEYANNLLRSGGAEIVGERGQAIPVQGEGGGERRLLPTPRGGAVGSVKRDMIVGGKEAIKIGAKAAVQQAGFGRGAAIPDVNAQQAQRAFVAGDPESAGAVAKIHETAQKMIVSEDPKKPTKLSSAERQLNSAYRLYEYTLRTQGAEAAQQAMRGVYQAYKAIGSQQAAFAKQLAGEGRVDEAVKVAVNAQAYFADGTDAKVSKDAEGNYIISTTDLETGEIVEQQMLTPNEAVQAITGWQSTDIEKQILRTMGQPVQSGAMDVAQRQLAAPVEPPTPVTSTANPGDVFARQAIPVETPIDMSRLGPGEQFTTEEQGKYTSALAQRNAQIAAANTAAQPPANVDRAAIRAEIAALAETALESERDAEGNLMPGTIGHSYELLKNTYGNNLNSILTNMLQTNPGEIAEQVVTDLGSMLMASNPEGGADRLPMQASRGDYEGTWKLKFVGSPTTYNVPSETAMAIRNGLMDKMQTEQEAFGKEVFEAGRDAPRIAEEKRSAEEGEQTHRKQERYTPQALGRKAGVKQGTEPLGPPIWKRPGYKPVSKPYSEGTPQRRF